MYEDLLVLILDEKIMEWMENDMLVVSVEGTASWGSFNFQGLCGNGWARVAK
nr:hypothetical protein [Tanacetum cinerariifolium]